MRKPDAKLRGVMAEIIGYSRVSTDGQSVDAQSIMGLMMLGAGPGSHIEIAAEGPDAEVAVDGLAQLIADRFDEDR